MEVHHQHDQRLKFETVVGADTLRGLTFPAFARVQFADEALGLSRPVMGLLSRSAHSSSCEGDQGDVRLQVEIAAADMPDIANSLDYFGNEESLKSMPVPEQSVLVLGRLISVSDNGKGLGSA